MLKRKEEGTRMQGILLCCILPGHYLSFLNFSAALISVWWESMHVWIDFIGGGERWWFSSQHSFCHTFFKYSLDTRKLLLLWRKEFSTVVNLSLSLTIIVLLLSLAYMYRIALLKRYGLHNAFFRQSWSKKANQFRNTIFPIEINFYSSVVSDWAKFKRFGVFFNE